MSRRVIHIIIADDYHSPREERGFVSREAKGAARSEGRREEYRCTLIHTASRLGTERKERQRERRSPLKCTTGFSSLEGRSRPLLTLARPTAPGYDVLNRPARVPSYSAVVTVARLVPRLLHFEIKR